jgi:hypothetical protein
MQIANVLIPADARPDVIAPLLDGGLRPDSIHGSGCKENKEGKEGTKEYADTDPPNKVRPEAHPATLHEFREHCAL